MSDIWVISDTHFGHKNILNFTDSKTGNLIRPGFKDVKEMDDHMVDRWNSVVKQGDKVYHLGDVTMGDKDEFKKLWPKLHGRKTLIVGNHDDIPFLAKGGFFSKVHMWRMLPEFGLLLSHVPLHESSLLRGVPGKKYPEEAVSLLNVHGHIHQNASPEGPYRNMSVEVINYTPVNIEEIRIK